MSDIMVSSGQNGGWKGCIWAAWSSWDVHLDDEHCVKKERKIALYLVGYLESIIGPFGV